MCACMYMLLLLSCHVVLGWRFLVGSVNIVCVYIVAYTNYASFFFTVFLLVGRKRYNNVHQYALVLEMAVIS